MKKIFLIVALLGATQISAHNNYQTKALVNKAVKMLPTRPNSINYHGAISNLHRTAQHLNALKKETNLTPAQRNAIMKAARLNRMTVDHLSDHHKIATQNQD